MEKYLIKFKHIVPTLLAITFFTTVFALVFRWVFTIEYELLPIKEDIFQIWMPIILPWIPITIWLRPKTRILRFKKKGSDAPMLFQFVAWLIIGIVLFISNDYLKTATGQLLVVNSIDGLNGQDVRYVSINKIEFDKDYGSAYTDFRTSGKYNQYLNFDSYFVYPFKAADSKDSFRYWYGVKIKKQISNKISSEEKEKLYKEFFKQAVKDFESYQFSEPEYFEIVPYSDDGENFKKAVERLKLKTSNTPIIIEPREGEYSARNGRKLGWIFGSFGIGFSLFLVLLIFPQYRVAEHRRQLNGIKPKSDDLIESLRFLIPKDGHFATSVILDINIIVFALMIFSGVHIISPNGIELLKWGANRRLETIGGDWWRLFTSMFIHGGIMHLLLNIYGLVMAALFVEPIFGRVRYFILYFISGICGSLASIYWYDNTISVGASGAIFGLYGAILGLLLTSAFPKEGKKGILILIGPYVVINLLFGLTGGIDNAAHIGGLVSGAILGMILFAIGKEEKSLP